ncbi:MAG: UbiX family flavin prenyltransferase [Zetaproteobacteria bacterium]|nr:UbiX family flavin prenyltransferase [Zetaproteobacteria bacterium]
MNQLSEQNTSRVLVGITGASGTLIAERLIAQLIPKVSRIYLCFTDAGKAVAQFELNPKRCCKVPSRILLDALRNPAETEKTTNIRLFRNDDLFTPVASGTAAATHMVIVPSSMGTIGRIAHGVSANLIERAADVMLKQKRPLLVCPRESPFNTIHLRNMLELSQAGAHLIPMMPGFYHHPQTILDTVDFCVGRILESLKISHELYRPWTESRL